MKLLEDFKNDIKNAVFAYLKTRGKKLSELEDARRIPCARILSFLRLAENDWITLKEWMSDEIDSLETGWIFSTGKSALKNNINEILNNPRYSNRAFVMARLNLEQQEKNKLKDVIEKMENGFMRSQLQARNENLENENAQWQEKYQTLSNSFKQLKQYYLAQKNELAVLAEQGSPTQSYLKQYNVNNYAEASASQFFAVKKKEGQPSLAIKVLPQVGQQPIVKRLSCKKQ